MTDQRVVNFYSRGVTDVFGSPRSGGRKHRGTDFSHSTSPGTAVPALLGGTVVGKLAPASWHGFGHQVTIRSVLNGVTVDFSYAHGNSPSRFAVGQRVNQGDTVITEGRTGWTNGSCVHIELFRNGAYVDPLPYIRQIIAGASGGPSTGGNIPYSAADKWIQQALNQLGYTPRLVEDGKRGAATIAQIKRYQAARGLVVDGIPGPVTVQALVTDTTKLAQGGSGGSGGGVNYLNGWAWKGIQAMLKRDFGYSGAIDGQPGAGTWSAMQRFLKAKYGYAGAIDGIPGGGTLAALARWLRARWGYVGNDVPGPVMQAAFKRAEVANWNAYT